MRREHQIHLPEKHVSTLQKLISRFLGFGAFPVMSALLPFLVLPVVARQSTVVQWSSILTGQAIGGFLAIITSYGWNVNGPARLAGCSEAAARNLYSLSFWSRLVSLVVSTLACAVASEVLTAQGQLNGILTAISAFSIAISGMSISWFAIGFGKPQILLKYELFPKLILTGLSVPVILMTANPIWYPLSVAVTIPFSVTLFHLRFYRHFFPPTVSSSVLWPELRRNLVPALIDISGGAYASAPVPAATWISHNAQTAAAFGSADKLYRYALFTITALANALQAWVLSAQHRHRATRQLTSIIAHTILGLIGGIALWLIGTWFTKLLFGNDLRADNAVLLWYGVSFAAVSISTPLIRNVLIPAQRARWVLLTTILSSIVGITLMIGCGTIWGGSGVAFGLAVSETFTVTFLAVPSILSIRRERLASIPPQSRTRWNG